MGRPHLKFLGGRPPNLPLGLRPCLAKSCTRSCLYGCYAIKLVSCNNVLSSFSYFISFIHSGHFYSTSSSPLYYSGALPTQHGYCAGVSRRSATGNCELRTCPRSL